MKNNYTNSELDRRLFYGGELGAVYSAEQTLFRMWAPRAQEVKLRLFRSGSGGEPFCTEEMHRAEKGVWELSVGGDLNGVYYTYAVTHGGVTAETIDIYARSAGVNGERGMVINLETAQPEGWENSRPVRLSKYSDAVIYEVHVRDFSADISADFTHRGKFLAFAQEGAANSFGDTVGLEYIRSLGVTHIHLLPAADFASVDESAASPQYNWGYDPLNFNLPEGSYSTCAADGFARVRELRTMICAAHEKGIGVIMDVVFNHTFSADSPFSRTVPDYYYRRSKGALSNGSGCGNEFASERRMAGKFICDSLCFWAREYKLDGFRFDLMGLLDTALLNRCAAALRRINPDILLYGEGWTGGLSPLAESRRAVKKNARLVPQYAMFSDDFRDGVKGSVFDDRDCGYVNGAADSERRELIKSVLAGGVSHPDVKRPEWQHWTDTPQQSVNYVESHDNLTLFDKLRLSMPDADEKRLLAADRMAAALVFLSQGIPFFQAGQELARSKPDGSGGYVHDSYNAGDEVNCIKWNDVTRRRSLVEYYRGLIALRRAFPQLRLASAQEIRRQVSFVDIGSSAFAMKNGGAVLLVNPTGRTVKMKTTAKSVVVYADGERASAQPLYTMKTPAAKPHSILFFSEEQEILIDILKKV